MLTFRDFIGNEYIRGFLQGAVRKGLDPHAILQKASIPPEAYDDPAARIDGVQLQSLIQATKEATNDIYLGFLETPAKLAMEFELAEKILRCETLGEVLKVGNQFTENYRNDFIYSYVLDSKARELRLGLYYKIQTGMDSHILHFCRVSNIYKFCSWLIGSRIKLTRVCFPEAKPAYCFDYERLFHCDIQFNQPECQICCDSQYVSSPVVREMSELAEYTGRYNDWLKVPGRERSLTSQIEQILLELQKENCFSPPVEVIAEVVSINPRTIRRMLARENESYHKIKSRVRRDLATKLLLTTEMPIAAIAEKVGFLDPSDFTRAFVRWTGSTPSAYRAANAGDKGLVIRSYRPATA